MFTRVYNKVKRNTRKGASLVALISLIVSSFVALDIPQAANAAIVTNNLVVNLDGTDTTSLAATSPTTWNSISPGSSTMSGTINNATRASGTTGGLNFVGTGTTGSYVNFGTSKGNIAGSISFDTWIKPGNLPANAWAIIASRWFDNQTTETVANHDFHFGIRTGATSGALELDTTTQSAPLGGTIQFPLTGANKWYHVGFVIDATSGKAQLFVNGVADSAQATMSHSGSANPQFWIGDGRLTANLAFNGTIAKARLYSAALAQSDMMQNFGADSTLFGYNPTNTSVPTLAGTAKVGNTLQTTDGNWVGDSGATVSYKWQSSPDGATWTDISGATSNSYTAVTGDAGNYLRSVVTKTNSNGSTSANSAASLVVQTANGIVITNGGTITGLTSTVPNDANIYQVTLASSNLSSTIALPNNSGLTIVNGYASTASYMATAFTGAPIISFRGTGTAINTALATATYTGTVSQTDTVKLYYARGTGTITDTDNYIPIYDNGKLTFHYYTFASGVTASTWQSFQTTLQTTSTLVGITSPYKWYLATPRYQVEDTRLKALVGTTTVVFLGGYASAGSANWYWPANTDGFTSAVQFATGGTGTSNIFNGTSTALPWQTSQPDYSTGSDRVLQYWYNTGPQAWDDTPSTLTDPAYASETFLTAPASSTGTQGVLAMSIRPATAPGVPTGLTASAPGTSVTLNWTAPASTGSDAISDYAVQYTSDNTTWTTFSHNAFTSPTTVVTGLTASTVYSFRVAAVTTLQGGWSTPAISTNTSSSGGFKTLSGYSVPTNTTGTVRVLLESNNPAGRLWVSNSTNIDGGIRGTANYPDNNSTYFPTTGYVPTNINSAGQMIGLVDATVSDLNTALASLRYQSPTASTDVISMWISNGTEYIPIINGSNVEFHYYGKNATAGNWATVRGTGYAGGAQTIDGVNLAAGTPFLATARYRAENMYLSSLANGTGYWLNASDDTAAPTSGTEGVWKWWGADANGVQFWNGSQTGSATNGEYNNWGWTSSNTSQLEPNGGTGENCMDTGTGYSNLGPYTGWAWNDIVCTASMGYIWEAYNTGTPYGSNSTNPAASNYAALVSQQSVSLTSAVAAPTALTATSSANGQVDLSWTAPAGVSGITSYSVQYSTDGINWVEHRGTASTAATESFTGLTSGTYYHFRVAAITSSSTGLFVSTYYTPTGTGQWLTTISATKTVTGLSVDSSLNSYKMSVLLYASSSTLQLGTTTNLLGIRGTANYSSLGTAGQMIGLTGLGSDINTALASLKYVAPATTGNQTISMWVSVGTTTALPQAYVPVVNNYGQIDFHYFGYSSDVGTWSLAQTKAQANSTTINGQSAPGKYLATAESADQNGGVGDALVAASLSGRAWLNGGDGATVASNNPDGTWYWLGQDTGVSKFYVGNNTSGTGGVQNGAYVNWGASAASTQGEPNGNINANCLMAASASQYTNGAWVNGSFVTVAAAGNTTWDDGGCNDGTPGYVWEYVSSTPVGSTTSGANYVINKAQSVVINQNADAPSNVTASAAGNGSIALGWSAPTVYNSSPQTGYTVQYSTSSSFTSPVSVSPNGTDTSLVVSGLTSGTTYYFRVYATGSGWSGLASATASAAANSTATTINIVSSGGGVAGTDYNNTGGVLTAKSGAAVSINAADIQSALLTGGVIIAADTVNVNGALSWSTSQLLTLGNSTSSTVAVNQNISSSGVSAGIKIAASSYSLLTKSGYSIQLTGTSPTFSIGGTSYLVVNTVAGLANVINTSTWALTAPITLTSSYTTAVKDFTFTGIMDGLGNTVNNMQITVSATKDVGFYAALGGATVRNVGFTNVNISSATNSIDTRLGSVAGNGSITASVTNTVNQVWATGFINQTGSGTARTEVGGLFGGAQTGTLNISKSWSSVAVSTTAYSVGSGGIIGTNAPNFAQGPNGSNNLTISESYSTGNILRYLPAGPLWYGNAGIIGVSYGNSTTITNVFSWGNINSTGTSAGTSTTGIDGVGAATITNAYTTYSSCGGTATNCLVNQTAGSTVSGGTGFTSGLWQSVNGTSLTNLTPPTKNLYVKVKAPTDGSYGTMSYEIDDSTGTAQTLSSLNLSVSGTPTYTINASTAKGTYSVAYVSGLTLGGTSAGVYSLSAWINNTSVTISKFPQNVTWSPTVAIGFGNGTFTPSSLASSDKSTTITYSVTSAGTTGCTVNPSTGVVTYLSAGTCTITASGDSTGDYLPATSTAAFVIAAAPTITIVASGGGVSGTDYTIANGLLTASANVSVNASDLATALASGNIQLAGNVVVNAPITWSSNSVLTLGGTSTNTVAVNASITGSGNTAGIVIKPATYSLSTKDGAAISLSGTSPTLSIGGNSYTLIKSIADLANVTATGNFALAVPLTYSTTLSASPITVNFAGTLDGLGNTIDSLKIVFTGAGTVALIGNLAGGSVRNLGLTNVNFSLEPTTSNYDAAGAFAGTTTGGSLDQVWSTGFIRAKSGSTFTGLVAGGLVGNSGAGTLTISKSWSSVNLYGWGSTFTNAIAGGLIGGDLVNWSATSSTAGGNVTITQSYATGDIAFPTTTGTTGYGGIFGVHIGTSSVSVTDVFSWSLITINTGANYGGIFGNSTGTTAYLYGSWTVQNQLQPSGSAVTASSNSSFGQAFGGTPGFTANSNWYASTNGRQLSALPVASKNFYVRVVAPTDGSYGTMSYSVINGVDSVRTLSAYGLAVSGTPTYSIASNVSVSGTPYNVTYVSGLNFTGTGTLYNITPYPFATAVTISKYPQTLTWTPTTSVAFGSGTITPDQAPTASGGTTITYAVTDAGTTGCSVNPSTGVITATSGGNCVVTATAANAGNYLAASTSVTFAIADASAAPTGVTTTSVASGAVMVTWTPPTPAASAAISGYQVLYSTSSSMTSPTTLSTGSTNGYRLVTGLAANTTYYFQVRAVGGSTWNGVLSSAVSGATTASSTTLTVATSGGTQGTTWQISNGVIYAIGSGIINVADLQSTLLTGRAVLAADTVNVNNDVTWATDQVLTLGYQTSNTVNINADLTASGVNGGVVITPATYSLAVKNGAQLILSGSNTTLSIGGTSFTLIRSIAGLSSVTASGNYALSQPLNFGTTALTAAPMNFDFTGTFDGLGNNFDGLTMTGQSGANSGLFNGLASGSLVRNLGITNVKITIPGSATNYVMVGVLAGWVPSGQSGTATVNKVWTTGFVNGTAGSLPTVGVGGLVAWARSGTLNISQSWSGLNIDTSALTPTNMSVGGLVGTNVLNYASLGAGSNVSISESYTTGNLKFGTVSWRGNGGIMGLAYATGTTTSITDSASYGSLTTTDNGNYGGVLGGYSQGTVNLSRVFTSQAYCGNVAVTGCLAVNVGVGANVSGANTAVWTGSGASYLVNLPAPKLNLYVKVTANTDGSFGTVGNQIVDGSGVVQNAAALTALNLSVSGTPTYSINSSTALGTYNTYYVSGLSLGGTNSGYYNLLPWRDTTSITISKFAQTVSITSTAPTGAKVGGSTYTPTGTATSSLTVAFTVDSSSSSICSISSGAVSFQAVGTCTINANQAGGTNYLAATQVQQSFSVGIGDQAILFTTSNSSAKVAGATYTPAATASSGLTTAFTIASSSSTICSISAGVVSFLAVGDCVINANQSGNTNWNAAPQVSQTVTVGKGVQAITFTATAPASAVVAGATYTPAASSTGISGGTITFTVDSSSSSICSISGGAVSFQAVGTCKVNADKAGNTQYDAAPTVSQSFTVGKGSQTISFSSSAPNAAKVGGNTYTVVANAGPASTSPVLTVDSSTSSKCSVSGFVVTYLAVGDCVLNLNQAGDANYNAATQVQQTVTITTDGRCPNGLVSGNYCLVRFNTSGTWTVPAGVTSVDMLAVGAGGGGGGGSGTQTSGGGGGGGEVIENLGTSVTPGTKFTITVGTGGTGGGGAVSSTATAGTAGGATSIAATGFTTITSRGGGQGGSWRIDSTNGNIGVTLPAGTGASVAGGGGGSAQVSTRVTQAGTGGVSNGGAPISHDTDATLQSGGGGGGAGGNGSAGTSSAAGAGGAGKASVILGTTLGGGGGGGKRFAPGTAGSATAGGGAGGVAAAGAAGTANTGGGGGGSAGANDGGAGGSGVVVIRIALTSQSVSFTSTAPTGLVFGTSTTYTPTVSGTASEVSPVITVDATSSSVCSIAAGVVSIIGAGTCTLDSNQAGNGFYAPATQVQQSFTVAKQTQAVHITSALPSNPKVGGSTYTPTATGGGSALAVRYSIASASASICSVTAGVVSFLAVGDCVVLADQDGNANYSAATQDSQTITLGKGDQTITFTSTAPSAAVVSGATYTPTATATGSGTVTFTIDSGSSSVCSIAAGVVSFQSVGSCKVLADQAGSANWNAATQNSQTFSVGKGTTTLAFTSTASSPKVNTTYTPVASSAGTGAVTYTIDASTTSICSISAGVVSFNAVGTCKVNANQVTDTNWLAPSQAQQSITVLKGDQTITFTSTAPSAAVVSGSTYTPTATATGSGTVTFTIDAGSSSVCSISTGVVSFQTAGSCKVLANQAGSTNWNAAPQNSQTFSVGKGTPTLAFTSSASSPKVNTTYSPVASSTSTGAVSYTIDASSTSGACTVSNGVVSFTGVGTCKVNANQVTDNNWLAAAQAQQSITVLKGDQTITFTSTAPSAAVVSGATYTPTATATGSGTVTFTIDAGSSSVCSIAAGVVSFQTVGSCKVLANQAGDSNWNAATQNSQTFSVGKGTTTLAFTSTASNPKVNTTYSPVASSAGSGTVTYTIDSTSTAVCSIAAGVVSFNAVGTCKVNANQVTDTNWLAPSQVSQTITVLKGDQTITFTSTAPSAAVVSGTTYTPTATATGSGTVTFTIDAGSSSVCSIAAGVVSFQTSGSCKVLADQAGNTNWNAATQNSQTFSVGKGNTTLAFTSTASSPKVNTTYTPAAGSSSTGSVSFTIDAASTSGACSISNGVVSFTGVGTCKVNANQLTDGNWLAPAQAQQSIAVLKGDQTITSTTTASNAKVNTTYTPAATATSTGSVVFTIDASTTSTCSIALGIVSFNAAGTCKVNANQAGNSNWNAASQIQETIVVGKGDQTISFTSTAPSAAVVSGSTYTPTATATGSGTVTFTIDSGSSSVCSISSGAVSFQSAGSCKVLADQAGNTNWNAATQNSQTFSVGKGTPTLAFTSSASSPKVNTTYSPAASSTSTGAVSYTIDAASTSGACTISNGVVSFTGVGTCKVNANQATDNNWLAAAQAQQSITVLKGDQTISFTTTAPSAAVVSGSTYTPAANSTSTAAVVFTIDAGSSSVCSISSGVVSFQTVGSCKVLANQAGNSNWNAAPQNSQTFSVGKGTPTLAFTSSASSPKVNTTYSPAASSTSTGSVTYSIDASTTAGVCTILNGVVSFSAAGTCKVNANQVTDTNWLAAAQAQQSITVLKGDQTIAFTSTAPTSAVVGGTTYTPTATATGSGAVTFTIDSGSASVCSISAGVVSFQAVGSCKVLADQAGNSNWNPATQNSQVFTVDKGAQAISFTSTAPTNAVVDGSTYTATATGGASNLPVVLTIDASSTDVCSISAGVVSFLTAGDCVVNANQSGDTNHNAAPLAQQTFTVGKGAQVIHITSVAPTDAVVDGSAYTVAATGGASTASVIFSIDASSSSVCELTAHSVTFHAAGDCVVDANQAGDANYNAAGQVQQTITVGKGAQVVHITSVAPTNAVVDGSTYTVTATGGASTAALVYTIDASATAICSISGTEVSFNSVGTCKVDVNQGSDSNYNAAAQVQQSFSVAKGAQVITETSTTPTNAVVDGATYTPTFTGGASGKPVTVAVDSASAAVCAISAGEVTFLTVGDCVLRINQQGDSNYNAAPQITETISVGRGVQIVSFTTSAPTNAVVGGTTYIPSGIGGASGNAVNFRIDLDAASVCAITQGVVRFIGVGNCIVNLNQPGNSNYNSAAQVQQTFAVAKGAQAISFTSTAPVSAAVGGAQYTPTATGGATNNTVLFNIASASTSICSLSGGKISFLAPGDCVVEANQAGNTNYNAADVQTQTISVAKGSQVISFTSSAPTRAKVSGSTYQPSATGGSTGNAVNFTVDASSSLICSVTNGVVSFTAVGNCVINANQAGDSNYYAANQVQQVFSVAKGYQGLLFTSTPPSLRPVHGTTYVPTATGGNSGLPIVYSIAAQAASICSIANGTISFLAVGDCVLYADQAGNANYNAAARVSQVFDITKGEQVVAFTSSAPTNAVVEGTPYTLAATGGQGTAPVSYSIGADTVDNCAVTNGVVSFQAAGNCTVVVSQAGDANYNAATPVQQTFTIGKGSQTVAITSTISDATVDGAAYIPTTTGGHSTNPVQIYVALVSQNICEVNSGAVTFHAVGDCVIEADQSGDANYEDAAPVTQTISVAKGNQGTLTAHSTLLALTLGGTPPVAVLSVTGGSGLGAVTWAIDPTSDGICSVSGEVVTGYATGFCNLIATKAGDSNYLSTTATLALPVSSGGQTPVQVSVSNSSPDYAPNLSLDLSLAGGNGDGAVWFESLTPHVCDVVAPASLSIHHAGDCTIVGHKDGDASYEPAQDELTFTINRAVQSDASISLEHDLSYSSSGSDSAAISVSDSPTNGNVVFSVTSGTCTVADGTLTATEAGDCLVNASVDGNEDYMPASISQTFTVGRAAQAVLAADVTSGAPAAIAWNGLNVTTFNVSGGSGTGALSAISTTVGVCSVSLTDSTITVTGLGQGTCTVGITKAGDSNYLESTTYFNVSVLDLPAAPTGISVGIPSRNAQGQMTATVSWTPSAAADTRAAVSGYVVQTKSETGDWVDANLGTIDAATHQASVSVDAWTKVYFRVAPISSLDASDGSTRNWASFDVGNDNVPDAVSVAGTLVAISTSIAASTSGETVTITGTGFDPAITTYVELTSASPVFGAGFHAAAVALTSTKRIPVTVISPTQLSFVLPKIVLPKNVSRLNTQIRVLATNGIDSDPVALDYIPTKLIQSMIVSPALPANNTVYDLGTSIVTASTITSSNVANPPVVTATPASVCTATINQANKLVITPVGPGTCSLSVVVPGNPGYLPSAAKTATYLIKAHRTAGLSLTARDVNTDGTLGTSHTFTMANTMGQTTPNLTVAVGTDPRDVPITLSARQGTLLFTVDPAADAAGICSADPGDDTTGLMGSITITDVGICKVTVSQPADAGWYAGETMTIIVNAVASTAPPAQDNGSATVSTNPTADTFDPLDPDDPNSPPVLLTINPTTAATYSFGTEDGVDYDPLTGKFLVRSRSALVGTWTATMKSPNATLKWFKIPGKVVKKVQQYTMSNVCALTLTVKKDPKIKKKVLRFVGAGCLLSPDGVAAMTHVGIQVIKIKYKRIRQYPKTGLAYQGTAKAQRRILARVNRTIVLRIGRAQ